MSHIYFKSFIAFVFDTVPVLFCFFTKEGTNEKSTALLLKQHRSYTDLHVSEVRLLLEVLVFFLLAISLSRLQQMKKRMQTGPEKHGHTGIQKNQNRTTDRRQCGLGVRGGSKHTKANRLHALAIRAAAVAAAVPEQSPPASRL